MPKMASPIAPKENRLLASLPDEDYERILPHLKLVTLKLKDVLYEQGDSINYAYFPIRAMISLVSVMKSGHSAEVGVVGNEGMVSTAAFIGPATMPYKAIVQISDGAVKIEADLIREEFKRGGAMQNILLRYSQALHIQVSQTAACNRLHSMEERLARWLLMTQDRAQSETLELTQEFLAIMLGSERSGVTLSAITLQNEGAITYSRGKITIIDRAALMKVSCECYEKVNVFFDNLLTA